MNTRTVLAVIVTCAWLLPACQSGPAPVTTAPPAPPATAVPPTNTPAPTDTPLPTETPRPTPTALPEGILFRDDFEGMLQPGWQWENENPAKWNFTNDGWLQIVGEHDSLLGENRQNNLLWYPLPTGDFVITTHLKTKPFANFHQAAIFIYEDAKNYITINRGYCDLCSTGGSGIYMDYKIGGSWGDYSAATNAEEVYLRLESKGSVISGYYAIEPDQWVRLGRFGNYFQFKKVGIGVSNVRATEDVVGQFDYFEISTP
jgi:regulation of enolase protein 1 (concanavalin A-like superfamily)